MSHKCTFDGGRCQVIKETGRCSKGKCDRYPAVKEVKKEKKFTDK